MTLVGRVQRAQVRPLVGGALGGAASRLPGPQAQREQWPQPAE
jgi:hypothetical protein